MPRESVEYKPGDKIGQYTITRLIGKGGRGAVYSAEHPILGRKVAIKTLVSLSREPEWESYRKRLFQEAQLMSKLDHPGIPTVYDVGEHDGMPFIASEYIEGISLSKAIESKNESPIQVVLKIMSAVAEALICAHTNDVVHKDINPDNIVIKPNGVPVLLDFALAAPKTGDKLLKEGVVAGTPAFMSPEHVNPENMSPRSDIWGIGATLFKVITGKYLITGKDVKEMCLKIVSPDPVDLSPLDGKAPEFVIDIIGKCLRKDPDERYQSADELKRALESAIELIEIEKGETVELATPRLGQTLLLHVEYQEEDLPGAYREYEIGKQIGSGSFGEVYRAKEKLSDRDVALKILKKEWLTDEDTITRFRREATILSRFTHPNILRVYNFGRYGVTFFIAMDLVEGDTLEDKLTEKRRMEPEEALPVMSGIFSGLSAIHAKGIVHRDLKPENISFKDDKPVLCDFGIAHAEDMNKLTMTGLILGTPYYYSPEQASGEKVTAKSDIYSAGVILYRMLSGEYPHNAETPYALATKIMSEAPVPITKWRDDLSKSMINFLDKILSKNPEARPQAGEAIDLVKKVLG